MRRTSATTVDKISTNHLKHGVLRFFQLFQRLLQKNRFVRKLTIATLSRAEIHVLIELSAMKTRTVSNLVDLLHFDQSSVSRLVQGLQARDLVSVKPSTKDRRVKDTSLSKRGVEIVAQIDKVAGALFAEFASRLSVEEQSALTQLFKEISDAYGQSPGNARRHESRLRMEQRRLSRAFGMLSQEAFGSDLTPTQWHILAEACGRTHPLTGKEACHLLGLAPANLTVALDRLSSLGYIRRTRDSQDSRLILINPTQLGRQIAMKVEGDFVASVMPVLHKYHQSQVTRLTEMLHRYVGAGSAAETVLNSLPGAYQVHQLTLDDELQQARAFVVSRLYATKQLEYLPESVIRKKSLVYSLIHESEPTKLLAVIEYQTNDLNQATLTLGAAAAALPNNLLYSFIMRCEGMITINHQIEGISCGFEPLKDIRGNS